nr:pentatricopeptide repeat-containing protein At1g11290, chloroplastic-like [Aegilops tauschii subsp. strangulata]
MGHAVHAQLAAQKPAEVLTAMASTYAKCRQPRDARMVFDNMPVPDHVAWNALVVQYVRNGITIAVMALVVQNGERPDSVMLVSMLIGCADAQELGVCREVHTFAVGTTEALAHFKAMVGKGMDVTDVSVMAALHACGELVYLDQGAICEDWTGVKCASDERGDHHVLPSARGPTLLLVASFTRDGRSDDARRLFFSMQLANMKPDSFTLAIASCT